MCFQVVDDVLDLTATDVTLGKPAGQDLLEGIYTLPVIYALADDGILRDLLGRPLDTDRLAQARERAAANGSVDAALAVARDHAVKASEALSGADDLDTDVTAGLRRLVEGLVDRSS
jgi:geranylgeranyl pyrophosphate synthase